MAVEERSRLLGPESALFVCDGENVGRATIKHKSLSLAETIVGAVLEKEKGNDKVTVTVRFRNGPPDTEFNVFWVEPDNPGDCYAGGNQRELLGQIMTDADGRGKARFHLEDGNPFPGGGVVLFLCIPDAVTGLTCETPITDFDRFTALFTEVFPPAP
jgi:hypothetical protein